MVKLLLWLSCLLLLVGACHLLEGKVIINDKSTVVYQKGAVTGEKARRLGNVLLDHGYFTTWDERTVYLNKKKNQYRVTFIIDATLFHSDQENMIQGFKVWQQWLQEYAFGYAPTLLIIADENKNPLYQLDSTALR